MPLGDLILNLMGNKDPRMDMLRASNPAAAARAAIVAPPASTPGGGDRTPAPVAGGPGTGAPAAPAAAPQPPVAQAYQSPPDLSSLYEKLMTRQNRASAIDTGIGLVAAAFAHPENRAAILSATRPQQSDPIKSMNDLLSLQTAQTELEHKATMRANLPKIAEKYGLDLDTATYLFDSGQLDNLITSTETPTAEMKSYAEYAKEERAAGRDPMSMADWKKQASAGSPFSRYSKAPTYTMDENNNVTMVQLGGDGSLNIPTLPDGSKAVKPAQKVDTGTAIEFRNPFNGELIKSVPKDNFGEQRDKQLGKDQGEDLAKLPQVESDVNHAIEMADELINDPAMSSSLGLEGIVKRHIPGLPEYGWNNRVKELTAQAFLQAYNSLRGTGQITEVEGRRAEQAKSRIDAATNEKDFREAVYDFKAEMKRLLDIAKARVTARQSAAGSGSTGAAPEQSQDDIDDLLKKYGGE